MSTIIKNELYDKVAKNVSDPKVVTSLNNEIDKYINNNSAAYTSVGPIKRPIFNAEHKDKFIHTIGLDRKEIAMTIKKCKEVGSEWKNMNEPFNIALCLALSYFANSKKEKEISMCHRYLIVSMYPSLHYKYFKYEPNEQCMTYTINNLSNKFKIKQNGYLWVTLTDIVDKCYELHEKGIKSCEDRAMILYIQDVKTRLNSFFKKIAIEFYRNEKEGKYLSVEKESFEEDNYYEADNNSYVIERITNNVVSHLVVYGPNMKLVELSAKLNKVSVNKLRSYTQSMIIEKQRDDIRQLTESILFLYLFSEQGRRSEDVKSNDFLTYCLKVYKKSNTGDKNILRIKSILDKWIDELNIRKEIDSISTINDFRKALFTFFVLSIQSLA